MIFMSYIKLIQTESAVQEKNVMVLTCAALLKVKVEQTVTESQIYKFKSKGVYELPIEFFKCVHEEVQRK